MDLEIKNMIALQALQGVTGVTCNAKCSLRYRRYT